MVILSVSVSNKKGKVLMARQYVPMSRLRIEGLLAAFPKLVDSEENATSKQHTFIETDEVRYIYQPMDTLYVLLITNMQSNIIEDLNTLRMIAKLVPEYCHGHDEETVQENVFNLVFAIDEVVSPMGYREQVNFKQIAQFHEMDSAEEKLNQIIVDSKIHNQQEIMKKKAKEFDQIRMKEQAKTGGGRHFPGSEYLSSLGAGFGVGSGDKAISSDNVKHFGNPQPTITTHGFGSDNMQSHGYTGDDAGSGGSGDDDERHFSSKYAKKKKKSGPRQKGLSLGGKSKKADDLFNEAMEADKQVLNQNLFDIMDSTRAAAEQTEESGPLSPVEISVSEKLTVSLDRDGVLRKFEVKGDMEVAVNNPDCGKAVFYTNINPSKATPYGRINWRLHPRMDNAKWRKGCLTLKDTQKTFRIGRSAKTSILKWRLTSKDDDAVPIRFEFWPESEVGKIHVTATYSVEKEDTHINNAIVSFPTPSTEDPEIIQADGEYTFDKRSKELQWILGDLSEGSTGSLEYTVEDVEIEELWPVTLHFDMANTFCGMEVLRVCNPEDEENEYEHDLKLLCHAEKYEIGEAS